MATLLFAFPLSPRLLRRLFEPTPLLPLPKALALLSRTPTMTSPSPSRSPLRIPPLGVSPWSGAPPKWPCSRCTLLNPRGSGTCDACGAARPMEVDASDALDLAMTAPLPSRSPMRIPPLGASAWSGAPPQWPCARCTLLNPGGSGTCDACGAARLVEVDAGNALDLAAVVGASFLPLSRCSKKRDRPASPDVVDVRADEGNVANEEDNAPAEKKGNSETHLDKKTIKIMTYNVWFREDLELCRRMYALGDLIQHHSPDLICFQEVTPNIYLLLQKSDWWQEYKCSLSQKMAMERPYYCMQMSKFPANSFGCIPFTNSIMERELCIADVDIGGEIKLVLATSHLESPCPGPPRWDQMYSKERVAQANESLKILGDFRNVIFCGDMNWDDKGDGPFPLPDGWIDAWAELKPCENGWTYDTKANGMLSGNRNLQKRLDRFICKLADFKLDSIEMIGKEAIPGISYLKEKKIRKEVRKLELPVLPSDHFGLVLSITHLDGSISSE